MLGKPRLIRWHHGCGGWHFSILEDLLQQLGTGRHVPTKDDKKKYKDAIYQKFRDLICRFLMDYNISVMYECKNIFTYTDVYVSVGSYLKGLLSNRSNFCLALLDVLILPPQEGFIPWAWYTGEPTVTMIWENAYPLGIRPLVIQVLLLNHTKWIWDPGYCWWTET